MATPVITAERGNRAPVSAVGFDGGNSKLATVSRGEPLPSRSPDAYPRFRSGVVGFVPAATATDIARIGAEFYGRVGRVERIVISGTATAASVIDVLVQRSLNGGGGTSAAAVSGKLDMRLYGSTCKLYTFSANRTSAGNGIDADRPVLGAAKLYLGTAAVPAPPLVFEFTGANRPVLRDMSEWVVINLNGQAIPAGTSLDIFVEWSEEPQCPVQFAGDSTTSNASTLFSELGNAGTIPQRANINNSGSNGMRLQDVLLNTSSPPYPLTVSGGILSRMNGMPSVMVFCYGINDMRQGAKTRAELISMIDAAIFATLNGTTSGATYTSPMGAGTTFTWPGTVVANPDCQIILWSPNMITTDGNGSSFVTLTGRFAAMTLAQAAQTMTDDLREAYAAFESDPRVFRVVHKQDIFGRTSTTLANSGANAYATGWSKANASLMTDILHPNARGQVLSARQIVPHIREALALAEAAIL